MNIRTFVAATPRDALRAARAALGEQAVVLSNRTVAAGTELMVMAPDDMQALLAQPAAPLAPVPAPGAAVAPVPQALQHELRDELKDELRSMRGLLESQLATLAWNGRQPEAKARALREMLAAGFSAGLSRYIAEHMPAAAMESEQAGRGWMRDILGRNLPVLDSDDCLLERGGVFALVGPTGVGKTTSTAKLAARCVARHGAARIALVTTDGYRIGAFEQLRIYGKLLGVMVHSVREAADLAIALEEMKHKHIVLIDTAGASQRDSMVAEQIAMLASGGGRVQRLLCLNTTSTAETLDEVVRAYRGDGLAGCILTKLDEASGIGGALDVAIRHKLPLSFIADGQRVPEDLHLADRRQLLERAFTPHADAKVFGLTNHDLPLVAANSAQAMRDPLLSEVQLG
jgi:flagellar biosynthesis protein FlhF